MSKTQLLPKTKDYYCSHDSREHNESILGTAPQVDTWLLLEYPAPWGKKVLPDSKLPEVIKNNINAFLDKNKLAKLLFIKNDETKSKTSGWNLFIAKSIEQDIKLFHTQLDSFENLADLNFDNPENSVSFSETADKLLLICTNGRRDKCCAKYGVPIYMAAKNDPTIRVWECSHIGQHRFAANALTLPQGIYYGRMNVESIDELLTAYKGDKLLLNKLRGRAKYSKPDQAAEGLLRQETIYTDINKFNLISSIESKPLHWEMTFANEDKLHTVKIKKEITGIEFYAACGGEKTVTASRFQLISHEALDNK